MEVVRGIRLAAVVPTAPDGGSCDGKVDAVIISWAALAVGVQDFDISDRYVLAVSAQSLRSQNRRELDARRGPGCFELVLTTDLPIIAADHLEHSRLKVDLWESEDKAVSGSGVQANSLTVPQEIHRLSVGNDVDRLIRLARIRPVPEDVDIGLLVLHHTVCEVNLFGKPDGIDLATDTARFARLLPAIGIG